MCTLSPGRPALCTENRPQTRILRDISILTIYKPTSLQGDAFELRTVIIRVILNSYFLGRMVLISITSDPRDFLSAPPPGLMSSRPGLSGRPVRGINASNGTRTGNNGARLTTAPPRGSRVAGDTGLHNSTAKISVTSSYNHL